MRFGVLVFGFVLTLPASAHAVDHALGIEIGPAGTSGSPCANFSTNYDCDDSDQAFRLFYGLRVSEQFELRLGSTFFDVRLTDDVDPIFNAPSVSSSITDAALLWRSPINDWVQWHAKGGLGYWEESRSGGAFLGGGDSSSGVVPLLGFGAELGKGPLRFGLNLDAYPGAAETDLLYFSSIGLQFIW
ncbi:hypothetical protein [Biformimicrobium ophioploci]|uniref:Outer membrane protein beta-barrel domain-containing protein n=1 Tax=Biformimicrobium ophioploci TaxID=3036711 RepID=A0ABQ6M097_9GAMM|nr:hypothetical protein [Microbulbifer sp. NKW57]GMG87764.1 hypothetical protein MNKW57_20850 [Microbulbifer sp. NKW57]